MLEEDCCIKCINVWHDIILDLKVLTSREMTAIIFSNQGHLDKKVKIFNICKCPTVILDVKLGVSFEEFFFVQSMLGL